MDRSYFYDRFVRPLPMRAIFGATALVSTLGAGFWSATDLVAEVCVDHALASIAVESAQSQPAVVYPELAAPPSAPIARRDSRAAARLMIVGSHQGELEPCGCSGGQLGGLGRLKSSLDASIQNDPGLVVVDCGELLKTQSDAGLAALKPEAADAVRLMERTRGETAAGIFQTLSISAVGLGPRDLWLGAAEASIRASLMSTPVSMDRFPTILRANILTNGSLPIPVTRSAMIPGKTAAGVDTPVAVYSIIDATAALLSNPGEALQSEIAINGAAEFHVVIFHGLRERARQYAAAHPGVDLWIVAPGSGSPDERPETVQRALLLHAGDRGRNLIQLHLARKGGVTVAELYKPGVVSASDPNDTETQKRIDQYRATLAELKIVDSLKGRRKVDPKFLGYAGAETCRNCHAVSYEIWKQSRHSHAMESMVARNGISDPECVKCHATGWHSDPPSGETSGYKGDGPGGKLAHVSCESCHGPALKHAQNPLALKPVRNVTCEKCHDHDNSPNFERSKYWPKIEHWKEEDPRSKAWKPPAKDAPESKPAK